MAFPVPHFRPPPLPEPVQFVTVVAREELQYTDRPIFKAPPLSVRPHLFDQASMAEELRRIGLGER
jgi:hypothetical protein